MMKDNNAYVMCWKIGKAKKLGHLWCVGASLVDKVIDN